VADRNVDHAVVESFGQEWERFDQSRVDLAEERDLFERYFSEFPWQQLPKNAVGFDVGCGTGRWARWVAPRVGVLNCIEPSNAMRVAERNLRDLPACRLQQRTVEDMDIADASCDFGYSLGVLHHIPDTEAGIRCCVAKLKAGAPFLVYLYYAFDNRPWWFRAIWKLSDAVRRAVSNMPFRVRAVICDVIATVVYWPLATVARLAEKLGLKVDAFPLAAYRSRTFYNMRTDALDRFGTTLEHRFTRDEIAGMMSRAGLDRIKFRDDWPYWCAVGIKR
jgi:SAM-dependent methyltransferase